MDAQLRDSVRSSNIAESVFATALAMFRSQGYANVSLGDIAAQVPCAIEDAYRHFPRKEQLVVKLYERLATELEERVAELPSGSVGKRFDAIVRAKLALIEPNRVLLRVLLPVMLDPEDRLGVLGPYADRIRARVQGVFDAVVLGSVHPPSGDEAKRLARFLYASHLALVFVALQDQSPDGSLARDGVAGAAELADLAGRFLVKRPGFLRRRFGALLGVPNPEPIARRLDELVGAFVQPPHDSSHFTLAQNLLRELFRHRRLLPGAGRCATEPCPQCLALHLPRVEAFLAAGQPLHFVLPAFPAKSANPNKVVGTLPDFGEELSLRFLQERCDAIRERYPPGARITICSDGRVFNDLVGVADEAVTEYRGSLVAMIARLGLDAIDMFDLDDVRDGGDFAASRRWLIERHAEPTETLVERTGKFGHHQEMYNGIHRFLTEDLIGREPGISKTQARNRTKQAAYDVIVRSNAWSRVVSVYFPAALRLSIHPQPPHAEKIGILLTPSDDAWLTPWHGVALLRGDRFTLTKRADAEALGATLIESDGRPSHYELSAKGKGGA